MENLLLTDVIRATHLLCVILGMGPAVYLDLRTLQRIALPISRHDIQELHNIHRLVSFACFGLWISGAALIWVRTGFDFASFSPKLWSKIIVVSVLTANAILLQSFVFPALQRSVGSPLISFPVKKLLPMALAGGISMAGWLLALALGSSQTLKPAGWDILIPLMSLGTLACLFSALIVIFASRVLSNQYSAGTESAR